MMLPDKSNTIIDYSSFSVRLEAQTDRWSLLKEMLTEWGVVVQREAEPEFAAEAIARAEERLGFALPVVLKEWYGLPFRFHRGLGGVTYMVHPSSEFEWADLKVQSGFVSFHREDQDCCEWGFRAADATLQDPPVYNGMELVFEQTRLSGANLTWVFQNRTLSEWVLHRTILDACLDVQRYAVAQEVSPDEAADLLNGFHRMGFPVQPWFQEDLFGGPNAIISTSPAHPELAWDRVKASRVCGPHLPILTRDTWDQYWEPATAGPVSMGLCCRDQETLEQFVSSSGRRWVLHERNTQKTGEHTEFLEGPPYGDPFLDFDVF